jgi:hypothetical protein
LLSRPDLILAYVREQHDGDGPVVSDGQRELRRVERQRAALAREEQRLIDAYQAWVVELEELRTRRQRLCEGGQRLDERAQVVRQQLVQAQRAATLAETVTAFCARIQAHLVEPSFAVKQKVLRLVVERIVVTDEEIVIEHVIPGEPSSRLHLRPSRAGQPVGGGRARSGVGRNYAPWRRPTRSWSRGGTATKRSSARPNARRCWACHATSPASGGIPAPRIASASGSSGCSSTM